ncbi:MAG: rhodanese-like domain-containing protein [Elusimicrobia bacterium]|nr:rhodanese-like domain-containing protein [Elusimicrobiota bacterium]
MSGRRPSLTAFAALALILSGCGLGAPVPEISVQELKAKIDRKETFVLLDVREPKEYAIARIAGSTLIPLGSLPDRLGEIDKNAKLIVHCKSGGRSAKAVRLLREKGYDAVNVAGGIDAWSVSIDTSVPRY